jgi:hypothetical protein
MRVTVLTWLPEFNVVLFAFLLNYPWEFIQAPLFEGMAGRPHWSAVKACSQAALGDAVIMLVAYWGVAALGHGRTWIAKPRRRDVVLLSSIGAGLTVVVEWLALHGAWLTAWNYSAAMPVVPGLGVGLIPVLQWVVLPPLVVALVARQLRGQRASP